MMKNTLAVWSFFLCVVGAHLSIAATVGGLLCESRTNPLGIDIAQPRS